MKRSRRTGAIVLFILGCLNLLPFTYSQLAPDTLDKYPSYRIWVDKYGYEEFESKQSRWFIEYKSPYYEYAIYSSDARFFIRNPDLEQLGKDAPRIREAENLVVHVEPDGEKGRGYRFVNIESERGNLYSFARYKYNKGYRRWFVAVIGVSLIVTSMIMLWIMPINKAKK